MGRRTELESPNLRLPLTLTLTLTVTTGGTDTDPDLKWESALFSYLALASVLRDCHFLLGRFDRTWPGEFH
jgi:hypothetical protein